MTVPRHIRNGISKRFALPYLRTACLNLCSAGYLPRLRRVQ